MKSAVRLAAAGLSLAFLCAAPLAVADSVDDGKKAFQLGVNLLTDPDGAKYDEALPHFKKAYELTKNWKVLGNLGLCYLKLERVGEAISTYERYLADGGKDIDKDEQAQINKDLVTLKAQQVKVHLEVPSAGLVLTDERVKPNGSKVINTYPLAATSADLVVYAGRHVMFVSLDGQQVKWETDLAPGVGQSHKFEKSAAPPPPTASVAPPPTATSTATAPPPPTSTSIEPKVPSGLSMPVYIAGGATAALALGTTITGLLYLGRRSDFNAINGKPDKTKADAEAARDKASTMSTVSTIFGAATVVGAGVTAYLFFTSDKPSADKTGKTRVSPWLAPGAGGFVVGGSL